MTDVMAGLGAETRSTKGGLLGERTSSEPLHVVLVAPPWYPIPPMGYGGIETVVDLLAQGLRRRGHRVTLIAAEGSSAADVALAPSAWSADLGRPGERARELTYAARVHRALRRIGDADVVHDHCGQGTLLAAVTAHCAPVVHTVHGSVSDADAEYFRELGDRVHLVAISGSQRATAPALLWERTVHNAADLAALRLGRREERQPYLLSLARISPEKGQHVAIEVARRSGRRLVLAGKIEPTAAGLAYYREHVEPAIDGDRVVHVHNVAGERKATLLAQAAALLAPVQWDEPFGLATVEAMGSGTPVLAFPRGAMPEVISDGVTGLLVDDADAMVAAVDRLDAFDPEVVAQVARLRFGTDAMVDGYLAVYAAVMGRTSRSLIAVVVDGVVAL